MQLGTRLLITAFRQWHCLIDHAADAILVFSIEFVELLIDLLVIGALAGIVGRLLDLLEFVEQVHALHLVLLDAAVAALPLEDVDQGKRDAEHHQRGQVQRETSQVASV